jgi:hypothetical protein
MARELLPLDIDDMPELGRIADEVRRTGEARVLRRQNRELEVVIMRSPVTKAKKRRPASKRVTEDDIAASRASAGSWKDVDIEKFKAYIYEGRQSSKPPLNL